MCTQVGKEEQDSLITELESSKQVQPVSWIRKSSTLSADLLPQIFKDGHKKKSTVTWECKV